MKMKTLQSPEEAKTLEKGQMALLSGQMITVRDGTLLRIFRQESGPKEAQAKQALHGAMLYFCGPTPARAGESIGSAGPTTTRRFAPFFADLLGAGVAAMVGKAGAGEQAEAQLTAANVPLLGTVGGAGAFLGKCVTSAKAIALPEMGTEAIWQLEVRDFPVFRLA